MKMTLAVLALCALAQSAHATGPDCSAIERTSERLACYDAASPPKVKKPRLVESDAWAELFELSSAVANSVDQTSMPSAFAVLR